MAKHELVGDPVDWELALEVRELTPQQITQLFAALERELATPEGQAEYKRVVYAIYAVSIFNLTDASTAAFQDGRVRDPTTSKELEETDDPANYFFQWWCGVAQAAAHRLEDLRDHYRWPLPVWMDRLFRVAFATERPAKWYLDNRGWDDHFADEVARRQLFEITLCSVFPPDQEVPPIPERGRTVASVSTNTLAVLDQAARSRGWTGLGENLKRHLHPDGAHLVGSFVDEFDRMRCFVAADVLRDQQRFLTAGLIDVDAQTLMGMARR